MLFQFSSRSHQIDVDVASFAVQLRFSIVGHSQNNQSVSAPFSR